VKKTSYPLRGIGPSIFLSYSYADQAIASTLESDLRERGLQVHKEDETSLIGQSLSEALQKRIAGREVFLQLLTRTSNVSSWVKREHTWAREREKQGRIFRLIPLVLERSGLPQEIAESDYVDGTGGLTREVIDVVTARALETVQLLPLSTECPFEFRRDATRHYLVHVVDDGRRVIVDSDGCIPTLMDELLHYVEIIKQPDKARVLSDMKKLCDGVEHRLEVADQIAPWLFANLHFQLKWKGHDFPECALDAVWRFTRASVGQDLLALSELIPKEVSSYVNRFAGQFDDARNCISRAQQVDPSTVGLGSRIWAAAGNQQTYDDFVELRFFTYNPSETPFLVFSKKALGPSWEQSIRSETKASSYVQPEDWTMLGVPQIAYRALKIMDGEAMEVQTAAQRVKWDLTGYRRLGP